MRRYRIGKVVVKPAFALAVILGSTGISFAQITAPPLTPVEHKRAAAAFAQHRARALEAVARAVDSPSVSGSSRNSSLAGDVAQIQRLISANMAAIRTDMAKATGDEKQALIELFAIYESNIKPAKAAVGEAEDVLALHDEICLEIRALTMGASRSESNRNRCRSYAEILTDLAKAATSTRAADAAGGGEFQLALTLLIPLADRFAAKEVIAEMLDQNVRSEVKAIQKQLADTDPADLVSALRDAKSSPLAREPEVWSRYHSRWVSSLSSHLSDHKRAYDRFEKAVAKPWTDFFKTHPEAVLPRFRSNYAQLVDRMERMESKADAAQKEKLRKEREAKDAMKESNRRATKLRSEMMKIDRHKRVLEEKMENLPEDSDPKKFEDSIEGLDDQLYRFQTEVDELERVIAAQIKIITDLRK